MTPFSSPEEGAARVASSMVALHPLARLTGALDQLEAAMRQAPTGALPVQAVLPFFSAGDMALSSPIAERARLQRVIHRWAFTEGSVMAQWGLTLRGGSLVVTDPVKLGVQLAAYPWLSRIMLKRLVEVWRHALSVAAWGVR